MSLNISGKRLLAEALEDAMERDLADVQKAQEAKGQHRFSGKFVRRMKRIESALEAGTIDTLSPQKAAGAGRRRAEKQPRDFAALGKKARSYGAVAAALVCVIGLVALARLAGTQLGATKGDGAPADAPEWEDAQDKADAPADAPADDAMDYPADDAPADDAAKPETSPDDGGQDVPKGDEADEPTDDASPETGENADLSGEQCAPGWQEQLLEESKKADALISWHLTAVYDGISFVRESELTDSGDAPTQPVSVSLICEVYYEQADGWMRVYRADRRMERCEPDVIWGDEYQMQELNMTRPGTYRVVRQVNGWRQVLELTLEEM